MSYIKLAMQLKEARREVYRSLPSEVRALHAILRLASSPKRQKKAFSKGQITQLVDKMLVSEGISRDLAKDGLEVPAIDWGKIYLVAVNSVARKLRLADTQREDFLVDVVGDMVMGQSVMSLRNTGPWKHNLMEQVEIWVRDGWSDKRIEATLTNWIKDKVMNLYKRWRAESGPADVGFQRGAPSDDYKGRDIYENLFTLDGLSSGQLSGYYSIMRSNPFAKDLVNKIRKKLDQRSDDLGLIWEAYMGDPSASMRDLLNEEVTGPNRRKMPLWEAMGYEEGASSNVGKIGNKIKNLRKFLRTLWPDIDDVMRDMSSR